MKLTLILPLVLSLLVSCMESEPSKQNKSAVNTIELLVYCGITMARPMNALAEKFHKQYGIKVNITQGGSKDLYDSLKASRVGDLYLPGSASYRKNNLQEGLLGDAVYLGDNKASIVVKKGNPKGITSDLKELTREDLRVVICDANTGSIGRETKKILERAGIYEKVLTNASYLTTDSKNLNRALISNKADVVINWHATTTWEKNSQYVVPILIDEKYVKKKKLVLSTLTFSRHPKEARMFLDFAGSEEGRATFKEYGF